jgi:hypothetical protein
LWTNRQPLVLPKVPQRQPITLPTKPQTHEKQNRTLSLSKARW